MNLRKNISIFLNVNSRQEGDCSIWTGKLMSRGYGRIPWPWEKLTGEQYPHRLSYALHTGVIWPRHCIIHRCLNKLCLNPEHLEQVEISRAHKYRDYTSQLYGPHNGVAKLIDSDVVAIRAAKGTTGSRELAARYGVKQGTIAKIWRRGSWKHLASG